MLLNFFFFIFFYFGNISDFYAVAAAFSFYYRIDYCYIVKINKNNILIVTIYRVNVKLCQNKDDNREINFLDCEKKGNKKKNRFLFFLQTEEKKKEELKQFTFATIKIKC
jgi:hypothetical protein